MGYVNIHHHVARVFWVVATVGGYLLAQDKRVHSQVYSNNLVQTVSPNLNFVHIRLKFD